MTVMDSKTFIATYNSNPDLQARNPGVVLAEETPAPVRKYRNRPDCHRGRVYSSIKEADYARQLDLEQRAGEVICWAPQVPVVLEDGITYVMDFLVLRKGWITEIVDVKGGDATKTAAYRLKKKMFKNRFGKDIKEV